MLLLSSHWILFLITSPLSIYLVYRLVSNTRSLLASKMQCVQTKVFLSEYIPYKEVYSATIREATFRQLETVVSNELHGNRTPFYNGVTCCLWHILQATCNNIPCSMLQFHAANVGGHSGSSITLAADNSWYLHNDLLWIHHCPFLTIHYTYVHLIYPFIILDS